MTDQSQKVEVYYADVGLLESISEFLRERGIDPLHASCEALFACDQAHARGIVATREHFEHAGILSGMHVLDVGCAIGGSSRYIALACECRVTGIDLTREYVEVARELTRRVGLDHRIEYFHANALEMPFDDASFDHAWCHNVTMNIENKVGLAKEIARVLKPRGRISCGEITLGTKGDPYYPLPWASDPASSYLVRADEMAAILEAGGFKVVERMDLTEPNMAYRREARERAKRGERPLSVNPLQFKFGDAFLERAQNINKSAEEGRLAEHLIIAEKV